MRNCSHVPERPEHREPFIKAHLQSEMRPAWSVRDRLPCAGSHDPDGTWQLGYRCPEHVSPTRAPCLTHSGAGSAVGRGVASLGSSPRYSEGSFVRRTGLG